MSKFILFLALVFLIYQVAKPVIRRFMMPPAKKNRHVEERKQSPTSPAQSSDLDYSKVRDVDFRDKK